MFGTNHSKLKTNLKIAIQRLKLIEKKKTENARKSTKEIADYLRANKIDRAKIKVEHIIREDYSVEGMEIVEMYCDLLLARFGLIESMRELDMGLYECVASLIWVSPRLESECSELKIIAMELQNKYGKEFSQMCRENRANNVNQRLMQKMNEQAPGDLLVEKYLVEIAKSHEVDYKPNPEIAVRDPFFFYDSINENKGGSPGRGGGGTSGGSGGLSPRVAYIDLSNNRATKSPKKNLPTEEIDNEPDIIFPTVPNSLSLTESSSNHAADSFDDLARRFENLKKK